MLSERELNQRFNMADEVKDLESPKTTEENLQRRRVEDQVRVAQISEEIKGKTPEQIARMIRAGERREQRTKKWAGLDSKTGLLTDKSFIRESTKKIDLVKRDPHRGLVIALGDLDDFGIYNKMYGEHVGDMVLRALGPKFKKNTRLTDDVSRYGGEEFGFAMPYSNDEIDPIQAVERIRTGVTEVEIEKNGVKTIDQISVTFGATKFEPNDNFKSMFIKSANALKIAKLLGKKRTVLAEHGYYRDLLTDITYLLETEGEVETLYDMQNKVRYRIEKNPDAPKARPNLVKLG